MCLSSLKHLSHVHSRLQFIPFRSSSLSRDSNFSDESGPSSSSWNSLIRAYDASDSPGESILAYRRMRTLGIGPNEFTFPSLLKACAAVPALEAGQQVQVDVIKHGFDSDVYVQNALIHFYGSCRRILHARQVFDEMPSRTLVSWNSIITACVENSWFYDSVELFVKMSQCGFDPNATTMVVLLSGCAEIGKLSLGRWIHSQVILKGIITNCQLNTALVEMYAKCGALAFAHNVFDRMPERNVRTWSAMVLGLAQHGFAKESLQLFLKMKRSSVSPNCVTFLGVLCACNHAGLVDQGYKYFHEMEHVYKIKPRLAHYGAMVDILGRAGHLKQAYTFIMDMPIKPDSVVWRTLLSACAIHNVNGTDGVEEKVRKKLLELEPRRGENFVMVANMYAEVGMWEKAAKVRSFMRDGGLKKVAGESCVEVGGLIRSFVSGNDCQVGCEGIYLLLDGLNLHMRTASSAYS